MTLSNSPLAFADCYAVMDAAIVDPLGVRIRLPDLSAAYYFRLRCHQARRLDHRKNTEVYEAPDPRHFSSTYDRLVLRIREAPDGVWIYFEKNEAVPGPVESLSGAEVALELPVAQTPAKLLPPPDLGEAFEQIEAKPEPGRSLRRL